MKPGNIESVCIFGSAARSSTDVMSDRDVLVVGDDDQRRRQLVRRWRAAGWSVASYSPTRLSKMSSAGSLFVQHLRLEGIIIADNNGWLAGTLRGADKKETYEVEALKSAELALPIERFPAETLIRDVPLVADLAYVALRNFGICYLADRGDIIFDYREIVRRLSHEYRLCRAEQRLAQSLRALKVAYREGRAWGSACDTVDDLRSLLSKIFEHHPLNEIFANSPVRELGSGYATLRDFEAAVVRMLGDVEIAGNREPCGLGRLWKMIRDPRTYAWDVRNLSRNEVEELRRQVESSFDAEAPSQEASCRPRHSQVIGSMISKRNHVSCRMWEMS